MEEIQIQPSGELTVEGRTVTVFFTQEGKKRPFKTHANTWGEFQAQYPELDFRKKNVVIKEGRHSLKVESAILPQGDFTLFAYPEESKSGIDLQQLGYNKGRTVAAYLNKHYHANINIGGKTNDILEGISVELLKHNLALNDVLKAINNPKSPKAAAKKEEPKARPSKAEKKSVKAKLAKEEVKGEAIKVDPSQCLNVPTPELPKAEETKKNEGGSCQRINNEVTSHRVDIHIHVSGIEEITDALKLQAFMPFMAFSTKRNELADKISDVIGMDFDKVLAKITLSKEEEARRAQEILDKQAVIEKARIEQEEAKRRIQEAEELAQKEKEEEEKLLREAREIGNQLR